MNLGLKGKQVFITGGSVGIGLSVARAFAREGSDVALGARNLQRVEEEAKRIADDYGVKSIGISVDVSRPEQIEAARKRIETEFSGIDVLVNNAGTGTEETIMDSTDDRWYAVWDLHVMSTVRTARAFVPFMRQRGGGVILNTASICATQPLWYEPIYNTTKAALLMLGKCMANEFVTDNIRVNTVSPGLVLTPDWWKTAGILAEKEGITPKEYLDGVAEKYAGNKRFASPDEIAEYYIFLASDCGKYSVGSNYYIDGGWLEGVR